MANPIKKDVIHAAGIDIGIYTTDFKNEFISLTDISRYKSIDPRITIHNWLRGRDVVEFLGLWEVLHKLLRIRKKINGSFWKHPQISVQLMRIVDETEYFVKCCERPGVVKRWQRINPAILFFDCAFDLMEESPETYREICSCSTGLRLACYPDEEMVTARKKYLRYAIKKYGGKDIRDVEDRAFQEELLRTLALVFQNDFGDD